MNNIGLNLPFFDQPVRIVYQRAVLVLFLLLLYKKVESSFA